MSEAANNNPQQASRLWGYVTSTASVVGSAARSVGSAARTVASASGTAFRSLSSAVVKEHTDYTGLKETRVFGLTFGKSINDQVDEMISRSQRREEALRAEERKRAEEKRKKEEDAYNNSFQGRVVNGVSTVASTAGRILYNSTMLTAEACAVVAVDSLNNQRTNQATTTLTTTPTASESEVKQRREPRREATWWDYAWEAGETALTLSELAEDTGFFEATQNLVGTAKSTVQTYSVLSTAIGCVRTITRPIDWATDKCAKGIWYCVKKGTPAGEKLDKTTKVVLRLLNSQGIKASWNTAEQLTGKSWAGPLAVAAAAFLVGKSGVNKKVNEKMEVAGDIVGSSAIKGLLKIGIWWNGGVPFVGSLLSMIPGISTLRDKLEIVDTAASYANSAVWWGTTAILACDVGQFSVSSLSLHNKYKLIDFLLREDSIKGNILREAGISPLVAKIILLTLFESKEVLFKKEKQS